MGRQYERGHDSYHSRPNQNELSNAHTIANLPRVSINGQVSRPEWDENIPVGHKAKHAARESHAIALNLDRTRTNTPQALGEMRRQCRRVYPCVERQTSSSG
jgi:hypothetical protein